MKENLNEYLADVFHFLMLPNSINFSQTIAGNKGMFSRSTECLLP